MRELIEHIQEAGIFKPVPKEDLKKREDARKAKARRKVEAFMSDNDANEDGEFEDPVMVDNSAGFCPVCGNDDISYDNEEQDGETLWYEVTCDECGASFNEVYKMTYSHDNVFSIKPEGK